MGKPRSSVSPGGVDEATKNTLLDRNLPSGQNWVKGKAFLDWALSLKMSDPDPKELEQVQCWQTNDGNLWAVYSPVEKNFVVGIPEGFKKIASLAQSRE